MSFLIPSSVQTMTSREVVAIINSLRPKDRAELLHKNLLATIKNIVEELPELNIQLGYYLDSNKQERPEYLLDKESSLLVVSGESLKVRHAIIKRWQELEAKQQSLLPTPATDLQFQRAAMLVQMCINNLNLPQSGQLSLIAGLGKQFDVPTGFLPHYGIDAPPESILTAGSSVPTMSLTTLLKPYDMNAQKANLILINLGLVEIRSRPSTTQGLKMFKALTEKGLVYGKNITALNEPREVQIHWYVDKAEELARLLGAKRIA